MKTHIYPTIIICFALSALLIPKAKAQIKMHPSGHISMQSLTTSNGFQVDTAGRISVEPNISSSYCKTGQTLVHTNYAKVWIVDSTDPALSNGNRFYVLGNGDIYGGSHYAVPGSGGGGGHAKDGAQPIGDASEIVTSLTGYYFDNHEFDGFVPDFEGNPEVDPEAIPGLLMDLKIDKVPALDATELEEVFPEAVRHDPQGRIGVNYSALVPVLVEAFKEQQRTIESLQRTIDELQANPKGTCGLGGTEYSKCVLYQNTPNPTNSSTTIDCFLDAYVSKATIAVYDLNGLQLKEYPVYHQGKNAIIIEANEFKPGIYMYSLLVDGKLIDTKRMVITSK